MKNQKPQLFVYSVLEDYFLFVHHVLNGESFPTEEATQTLDPRLCSRRHQQDCTYCKAFKRTLDDAPNHGMKSKRQVNQHGLVAFFAARIQNQYENPTPCLTLKTMSQKIRLLSGCQGWLRPQRSFTVYGGGMVMPSLKLSVRSRWSKLADERHPGS